MPRRKAEAQIPDSEEQAKAPKKWTAKQENQHKKLQNDLERTLAKHREDIARMSEELYTKKDVDTAVEQQVDEMDADRKKEKLPEEPDTLEESETLEKAVEQMGNPDPKENAEPEKPLEDPTAGQDLTNNVDMTMEEFFKKTLKLLEATTNAVRTMEYRYGVVARKLDAVQRNLKHRDALEKALGFKYANVGSWYTPRLTKCPKCGEFPTLQREKGTNGWLVICDNCWTRALTADGPMAAIKNWNDGKETELSRMLNRPLKET